MLASPKPLTARSRSAIEQAKDFEFVEKRCAVEFVVRMKIEFPPLLRAGLPSRLPELKKGDPLFYLGVNERAQLSTNYQYKWTPALQCRVYLVT